MLDGRRATMRRARWRRWSTWPGDWGGRGPARGRPPPHGRNGLWHRTRVSIVNEWQGRARCAKLSVLRRAFPRTKNGNLAEFLLGVRAPRSLGCRCHRVGNGRGRASGSTATSASVAGCAECPAVARCEGTPRGRGTRLSSRNMPRRCSSKPIISGWTNVSKMTFAHLRSPSAVSSAPGSPCTWTGAEMTAQGTPRRLATWRSIWVPSTSSGCSSADGLFDSEEVVA